LVEEGVTVSHTRVIIKDCVSKSVVGGLEFRVELRERERDRERDRQRE
jgi:hypothetical protein